MATYTNNLNLKKPATTDNVNIADINGNMDTIDGAIGDLSQLDTTATTNLVSAINELAEDYIVEQGTSGGWTYRKWNSGIAECWITQTISATLTWAAWGSLFSSNENIGGQNFPFTFSTITDYQSVLHEQNHWLLIGGFQMSKVGPIYVVSAVNNKSVTGKTYTISVKGTWK